MSERPRQDQPSSRPPARTSSERQVVPPPPSRNSGYNSPGQRPVQPQRDLFPYIMGGIIGAMIIGLGAIIVLILTRGNANSPATVPVVAESTATAAVAQPTPPRMKIDAFKALYDDPARRPLIIDVRTTASYDQGHILGAVSMPESDIDTLVASNKIPKDKMVVAYCQ